MLPRFCSEWDIYLNIVFDKYLYTIHILMTWQIVIKVWSVANVGMEWRAGGGGEKETSDHSTMGQLGHNTQPSHQLTPGAEQELGVPGLALTSGWRFSECIDCLGWGESFYLSLGVRVQYVFQHKKMHSLKPAWKAWGCESCLTSLP